MRPADEDVTSELLSSSIRKANPPLFDQRLFIILADGHLDSFCTFEFSFKILDFLLSLGHFTFSSSSGSFWDFCPLALKHASDTERHQRYSAGIKGFQVRNTSTSI